ncbi:MAG: 4-hydroxyphenylpyruvate dioxygenase [Candidatus Marinimicrobia bacterium]|jgi:4-hydroxyphenylpyruvate dioxygenase|nr:4-hydroxyphenylpyruvate dioxygenase [Candidatus Neomarinimicrobiota bacterium]MBT3676037.1 4-hydroxyphenylpyruvate dioxygenase [Candidatus Neomarinimicrobiota bacterium]MBT3762416.1 4-hydroxyphenylpyruvate dioxygenase [Candidatus Neomarinimicrobiota bacterium]MBT4067501.1 4-hydroxyphenylpyruvate dioxygenase [Candidatus Neomarinimicrobiota bacterium]MBT4271692.1 4-hydroxyphenylpyruvate dioxygenase [Candidatus Neomarinimicrobiota bacterium]
MNNYKINAFDHCELYVSNAKQAAHYYRSCLGFQPIGYKGLETGSRDKVSYVMKQNQVRFVLSSPLSPGTEMGLHIDKHGDGVKDVSFSVDNAENAWKETTSRGAESVSKPKLIEDEKGEAVVATIKTYGDTTHTFVERNNYNGVFLPGYEVMDVDMVADPVGIVHIDHVVGNQPDGVMQPVCDFYEKVFGWHRFWSVDDKDVSTEYTSLRSVVMANENEKIKMPINEPADGLKKSQIQEFVDFYEGAGVQHIAMSSRDIIETVKKLRAKGVDFLPTPQSYYDTLIERVGEFEEDIKILAELGILVDADENGYMLQIFTKPIQDRPTLFYEIIQRKGSNSFGKGNFKALFESIEREQALRGNL